MTTPENPFAGSDNPITQPTPQPAASGPPLVHAGVVDVFPSWGLLDVVKIAVITLGSVTFSSLVAFMIATALPAFRNVPAKELLTDARIIVPSQIFAYIVVLFFMYRIVAGYRGVSFSEAIEWRWPDLRWPHYLVLGAIMAVALLGLQNLLPMPKQTPIEQLFRTASGAWVMAVFGVCIAPLVEELFFRGLLFPVLAKKTNIVSSVLLTAFLFALIHASQLGKAWAPVLVLFLVGVSLTVVRWWARSVAAAVLVHIGYNLTLFSLLFVQTDGFRHMEKIVR